MPIEAAYMYDAVKIYAEAVHRVLASGHDHRNGTRVIEEVIAAKGYYSEIQGKRRVRPACLANKANFSRANPANPATTNTTIVCTFYEMLLTCAEHAADVAIARAQT